MKAAAYGIPLTGIPLAEACQWVEDVIAEAPALDLFPRWPCQCFSPPPRIYHRADERQFIALRHDLKHKPLQ